MSQPARTLIVCAALAAAAALVEGAYLRQFPTTLKNPDGSAVEVYLSGDEFFNWAHDAGGYTVLRHPRSGRLVYAAAGPDGAPAATEWGVGAVDPATKGLRPGVLPPAQAVKDIRMARLYGDGMYKTRGTLAAPTTGVINNIVVFVRFGDDTEFASAKSAYEGMFNDASPGACSMKNYYAEASYAKLAISSTFYPAAQGTVVASYQDVHPRSYFMERTASNPGGYSTDTEKRVREQTMLKDAVVAIRDQVPKDLVIDGNGDGKVDSVIFVVKGGPAAWNNLLWPHQWELYSQIVTINDKRVWDYDFQLEDALAISGTPNVGVLCHEMNHTMGAPDLYHYTDDKITPAGPWDIMEFNMTPPQHMCAYLKWAYFKWIPDIPWITEPGVYTIYPLSASPVQNAYRVSYNGDPSLFFVVEQRSTDGLFDSGLPGGGLLVYRVDSLLYPTGNRNGPPDEVYFFRPGGEAAKNGNVTAANFSVQSGKTEINDFTDPSTYLSDGTPGRLEIRSIGSIGPSMSFTVEMPACGFRVTGVTPRTQTVDSGQTASLSLDVSGDGARGFTWYKGRRGDRSSPIPGSASSTVTPALASASYFWAEIADGPCAVQSPEFFVNVNSADFSGAPPLPGGGRYRCAGAAPDCRTFYVFGGTSAGGTGGLVEKYDPSSGIWTTAAPMPTPLRNVQAAAVDGVVYLPGGYNPATSSTAQILQAFDSRTGIWLPDRAAPPVSFNTTAVAIDGKVYCFGGAVGATASTISKDVWAYDPKADAWTSGLAPMPTARAYATAVAAGGRVYVVGGINATGAFAACERYDPVSDTWERGPGMNSARMNPVVVWSGDYLYALMGGGVGGDSWSPWNTVERYRISDWPNGRWEAASGATGLPVVGAAFACTEGGGVYIAGGARDSSRVGVDQLLVYSPLGFECSPCRQPVESWEYYCAHVASDAYWWTRITLVNAGSEASPVLLEAIDTAGKVLESVTLPDVAPLASTSADVSELFGPSALSGYPWVRVTSRSEIRGVVEFGTRDGRSWVTLPMVESAARSLVFPYVAMTDPTQASWYTGVTLVNPGGSAATVTMEAYDVGGNRIAVTQPPIAIAAGGKYTRLVDEVFPGADKYAIRFVSVFSDAPLVGFELFGSMQPGWNGLAGLPAFASSGPLNATAGGSQEARKVGSRASAASADTHALFFTEVPDNAKYYTGVTFSNTGGQATTVHITLQDAAGAALREADSELMPFQQYTREIWSIFDGQVEPSAATMKLTSSQPLAGFELVLSREGSFQLDGLTAMADGATAACFPLVRPARGASAILRLTNPSAQAASFDIEAFDAGGASLGTLGGTLAAGSQTALNPADVFAPSAGAIAWIVVESGGAVMSSIRLTSSDGEAMAGYPGIPLRDVLAKNPGSVCVPPATAAGSACVPPASSGRTLAGGAEHR